MLEDIGKVLRRLRERRGLTQKELAQSFGCGLTTILRWEKGTSTPALPTLNDLLTHLEVDFSEFVSELADAREEVSPLIEDLSNPDDFVPAQALLLSKEGKDVGAWLTALEEATRRLRRAEMWADRRWAERKAKDAKTPAEPEEPEDPEEPEPEPEENGEG